MGLQVTRRWSTTTRVLVRVRAAAVNPPDCHRGGARRAVTAVGRETRAGGWWNTVPGRGPVECAEHAFTNDPMVVHRPIDTDG